MVSGPNSKTVSISKAIKYGDGPFVVFPETSKFGSPGGGKESVYRLYLVTTLYYFARI